MSARAWSAPFAAQLAFPMQPGIRRQSRVVILVDRTAHHGRFRQDASAGTPVRLALEFVVHSRGRHSKARRCVRAQTRATRTRSRQRSVAIWSKSGRSGGRLSLARAHWASGRAGSRATTNFVAFVDAPRRAIDFTSASASTGSLRARRSLPNGSSTTSFRVCTRRSARYGPVTPSNRRQLRPSRMPAASTIAGCRCLWRSHAVRETATTAAFLISGGRGH